MEENLFVDVDWPCVEHAASRFSVRKYVIKKVISKNKNKKKDKRKNGRKQEALTPGGLISRDHVLPVFNQEVPFTIIC